MPVLDMIECALVKHRIPNGLPTRLVYRSIYVCFTGFLACTIPFFGGELQSLSSFVSGIIAYFLSVLYAMADVKLAFDEQYMYCWTESVTAGLHAC